MHAIENPKGLHLYGVRSFGDDIYIVGEQGLALKLDRDSGRFVALTLPYQGTLFGMTAHERAVVAYGLRGNVVRSVDGGTAAPVVMPASFTWPFGR